jgi:hypothetical protein
MKQTLLLCLLLALAIPATAQKIRKPVKYSRIGAVSLNTNAGFSFSNQYIGTFYNLSLLYEYHINAYIGVGMGTNMFLEDFQITSIGIPIVFNVGHLNKRHRGSGFRVGVVAQLDKQPFLRPIAEYKVRIGFGRSPVFFEPNIFMTYSDGFVCTNGTYTCYPPNVSRSEGPYFGFGINLGFYPFKVKPKPSPALPFPEGSL